MTSPIEFQVPRATPAFGEEIARMECQFGASDRLRLGIEETPTNPERSAGGQSLLGRRCEPELDEPRRFASVDGGQWRAAGRCRTDGWRHGVRARGNHVGPVACGVLHDHSNLMRSGREERVVHRQRVVLHGQRTRLWAIELVLVASRPQRSASRAGRDGRRREFTPRPCAADLHFRHGLENTYAEVGDVEGDGLLFLVNGVGGQRAFNRRDSRRMFVADLRSKTTQLDVCRHAAQLGASSRKQDASASTREAFRFVACTALPGCRHHGAEPTQPT